MSVSSLQILIVGCGGLGGISAARLVESGHRVTAITGNPDITEAIRRNGLTASFDEAIHHVTFAAHTSAEEANPTEPYGLCILAVPPDRAITAMRSVQPSLADDACVVCLPNGLIEERLSAVLPADRVVGGIVEFGARMLGPGRVAQTAPGGFTVGRLPSASSTEAPGDVVAVLENIGPVHQAANLRGARWSKLAINCAISSLGTIGGDRLGVLMRHRFVRRLALEVMTEVVDVARAEGVELEKVSGTLDLEWMALDDEERLKRGAPSLLAKHTVLLAVGTKYRKMRSSMLAALERGRTPPVDYLNGEVVTRGEAHGVATPINALLQETVHRIARGELRSSVATLEQTYESSRSTLRELEWAI